MTSAVATQIGESPKSAAVTPPPSPERLQGSESEALFAPGADPSKHNAAKKRAIKLALAGDGYAAFELGVLFRHGMDHPARAVERDLDTARSWLERCVKATACPRMALVSLAELELQAGNYRTAMQWAQAWATLDQQLKKTDSQPPRSGDASYSAYLLTRCFEYLPKQGREDAVAHAFTEFLALHGKHLDRMLAKGRDGQLSELKNWAEFAAAKSNHWVNANRTPKLPSMGLFLLRAAPQGGRAEAVILVEALPSPRAVLGLEGVAMRFESKAYRPGAEGERRYGFLPIDVADPRYALKASTDR